MTMGKMFAANVALSAALLAACAQPNTPVPPPAPPKPAFGYHDVLPQAQQHLSERARTYIRTAEAMARKAAQREAEAAYRIVLSDPRLTPYERATIWQSLAYQQAERSNYRGAIESFLASLDESDPDRGVGLPLEKIAATLHNIGQLYMVIEDYEKAVIILEGRRRFTVNVTPPQEALLATAYFQLGRHDDALASIRSAIAGAGRDSPENWRQL
ncbi:MAG: hypothetical protein SFV19_02370 [Rhodospirillaceae bacterium]|nr:hypothetical protein [Rhodospirillaceae bacterium]